MVGDWSEEVTLPVGGWVLSITRRFDFEPLSYPSRLGALSHTMLVWMHCVYFNQMITVSSTLKASSMHFYRCDLTFWRVTGYSGTVSSRILPNGTLSHLIIFSM